MQRELPHIIYPYQSTKKNNPILFLLFLLIGNVIFILLFLLIGMISDNRNSVSAQSTSLKPQSIQFPSYKEVSVLCYHNINTNPGRENNLSISALHFENQIKALYDSGYHSIMPDQLVEHLTKGLPLPTKPVMFTFDDSHEEHFTIAAAVLEKYQYRGVFFIMTVCVGKKKYLTAQQIKTLADRGHIIECHTYDHPSVTTFKGKQWERQIDNPKKVLEGITGKPVEYFAYPYGVWNDAAISELQKRGFKAAFQLTDKTSKKDPLYTIQRMLVSGTWSGKELQEQMKKVYDK